MQVIAREFGTGFLLGEDDLVRMAVLWVTMVGAVVAIGDSKHIRIDLIDRLFSITARRVAWVISRHNNSCHLCSIWFLLFRYDRMGTYVDGHARGWSSALLWIFETVIPGSAFLMTLRFTLQAFTKPVT